MAKNQSMTAAPAPNEGQPTGLTPETVPVPGGGRWAWNAATLEWERPAKARSAAPAPAPAAEISA